MISHCREIEVEKFCCQIDDGEKIYIHSEERVVRYGEIIKVEVMMNLLGEVGY